MQDPDPRIAIIAAKEVLERGIGKVREQDPNADSIANLPPEQRGKAIMERLAYAATLVMPPGGTEDLRSRSVLRQSYPGRTPFGVDL